MLPPKNGAAVNSILNDIYQFRQRPGPGDTTKPYLLKQRWRRCIDFLLPFGSSLIVLRLIFAQLRHTAEQYPHFRPT
jgi:hypothetical protein